MLRNFQVYTDIELIRLLRNDRKKAEPAFTELYQRYSSMVHAYCQKIINQQEAAEDIFQETFIKFYQNVRDNPDNTNVPGYLLKIARNLCLNYKRDKVTTIPIDGMDFLHESDNLYEKKELLELITMSLELLDFDYREAFVLKEYDGLTYEEIAEICSTTVGNAKSRVSRAKQKIKNILAPYLNDLCKQN